MKNVLKRAISVLIVAVMVFGSSPFAGGLPELNLFSAKAEAAEAEEIITIPENELEWSTDENGNVTITGYYGGYSGSGTVKIPSTVEGKPVTAIDWGAFSYIIGCDTLLLPESVKTIADWAFDGAEIKTISLGNGVETVGEYAFADILEPFIIYAGRNLKSVGENAFGYEGCYCETIYYQGTREEWDAIEFANNKEIYDERVVCLGKPVGKSNIDSYAELDSAYDSFVYIGTEVYEVSSGELTDYKVRAGDWLEFRTYIKSDFYVGLSSIHSLFDNSFFDVSAVADNTAVNSGNSSLSDNVQTNAGSNAASNINNIKNYSGLDEAVINSNNDVWVSTSFNTAGTRLALKFTDDGWFYSYRVQVREGLEDGAKASVSSPSELWQSHPGVLTEKNRRPSNVRVSTVFVSDSAPLYSACKTMAMSTYNGTLTNVIIDDMNHEFTVSNGEEGEKFYVFNYDSEGYLHSHTEYAEGETINIENSSDDYAGTIDLKTGKLIDGTKMPACNINAREVSTSERFDLRIHLDGGTFDSSALPEDITDNGDGTLTVKIPFNSELNADYLSGIFGNISPVKEGSEFSGIFETADGITSEDSFTLTDINGVDFHAKYYLLEYTATFYYEKGATEPVETYPAYTGALINTRASTYTAPEGKKFAGWADCDTDEIVSTTLKLNYSYSTDKSFYAVWEDCDSSVTVMVRDYKNGSGWKFGGIRYGDSGSRILREDMIAFIEEIAEAEGINIAYYGSTQFPYLTRDEAGTGFVSVSPGVAFNGHTTYYLLSTFDFNVTWKVPVFDAETEDVTDTYTETTSVVSTVSNGDTGVYSANALYDGDLTPPGSFVFSGWIDEATGEEVACDEVSGITLNTNSGSDRTFVANYVLSGKNSVKWIVDGEKVSSAYYLAGDSIAVPENPEKEGYVFSGWTPEIPATMPDYDLEFTAVFTLAKHTVTWIVDGNETVDEYSYGDEIVMPENPEKAGFTFAGWGAEVPSTVPDEDLVFTAQWETNRYTVTWIVDGNETVAEYNYGDEIAVPETPVKEGYTFEGWTPEVPATMPEQDLEFVAVFTLDRHTVTWVVDGAETVVEYGYGEYIYYPQTPYKAGYTFVGWTPEVPAKMPDEDLTFTAQWRINKHTVTWIVDGNETVDEYSYGDEIVMPENPVKEGYIFSGWTPEPEKIMPDYNLYYTATWIRIETDNSCGENLTWAFDESTGELTISGTGEMAEWGSSSSTPWYDLSGLIKKVTIEDGVTNIGWCAFYYCTNLASVTIPGSVKNIDRYVFAYCTSIINIAVDENNQYYSSDENGVLFNKDKTELIKYTTGSTKTSYVIPDSVTSISDYAFEGCTSLVSVEIPDSVTAIGEYAFEGCTSLASVTISDSVTSIGYRAFFGCTSLTSVTIPAGVTSIGHNAFEDCTSLASVTIPDSVTGISTYAFEDTAVYNNSENWENDVFYIGNHLISAKDTLSGNYKVKDGTKTIGVYAFRNCINLEGIVIPDSVFYLGAYAFEGCEKLKDVTLSHNITAINTCTFYFCSSLTDIEIPEGVTKIGLDAFLLCQNLKSITLPLSLREIEFESFSACPKLTSVYYPGTPEQWMMTVNDMSTYTYDLSNTIVYECNSARPYYSCINYDHIDWTLDPATGELVINGWGDMYYTPWNVHSSLVKSVTISEGITSIYDSAFYGFTGLTSVIIPDSVTKIGDNAFSGCTNLTSVTIPDSVTSIANNAFEDTAVYNNGANWENGVLYIGNHLIKAEESLSGDYQIRTGTRTIAANAFRGCTELTGVTIPNSVVSIGDYAFSGCSGLTSVVIPNGVKGIGNGAFSGCTNIADIILPDSIESIGYEVFNSTAYYKDSTNWENGVLYINNCLVGGDGTPAGTYPIREGTVVIGGMVFMGCESLTGVVIPDSVKGISGGAFLLSGLTSVTIPDSVTSIGESAFAGCEKLTSITIPDSVTSIGEGAFGFCTSLVNITIPDSVTSIGESAFAGCSSLTSLVIPDSVTSPIREDDFDDCTALATLIIGDGVSGIEDCAFEDCGKFETIVIGNGVRIVGSRLFPEYSFRVETFVVGSSVRKIGSENFGFLNIKNLIILNGIKRIEKDRFRCCYGNEYIHIPSSVVSIEEGNIWPDSDRAKNVEIAIEEMEKMSESSMEELAEYGLTIEDVKNWPKKTVICSDTEDCYAKTFAEQNGNEFRVCSGHDIPDIPETPEEPETPENPELITGTCGENLTWTLNTETGEFVISGTGDMMRMDRSTIPWHDSLGLIKKVIIEDGVTSISDYAFSDCTNLASVTIGNSVTSIGEEAFYNCTNLVDVYYTGDVAGWCGIDFCDSYANPMCYAKNLYLGGKLLDEEIVIPDNVTKISDYVFYNCTGLKKVTVSDGVTVIGSNAFRNCTNLADISIPDSVTAIGSCAFFGCTSLASVTIPAKVKIIFISTFNGCTSLESVTFPDGMKSIGDYAFNGCTSLASVTIPDSVTSIGEYVFDGCASLASVTIGNSVTSIGEHAFDGCTSLASVTVPGSVTSIGSFAFGDCSNLAGVTISDGVKSIDDYVFFGCVNLESVTIPDSVTYIGQEIFVNTPFGDNTAIRENGVLYIGNHLINTDGTLSGDYRIKEGTKTIAGSAFNGCTSLASVTIPDGVTSIGEHAFDGCTSLASVTVPDSVTRIGYNAFSGCSNLADISLPDSIKTLGSDVFKETAYYNNSANWENSVLYINNCLVGTDGKLAGDYQVKDGTVAIADGAFMNCTELTSVTIPDGITRIGAYLFYECSNLTSVTIPEGVTSIGERAFGGCKKLRSAKLPDSLIVIEYEAFIDCRSLERITIPDGVTSIGEGAFVFCVNAKSVVIPDSVTSIGMSAFAPCYSMDYIHIPSSVTSAEFEIILYDSYKSRVVETYQMYLDSEDEEFLAELAEAGVTKETVANWKPTTLICSDSEDSCAEIYAALNGNEFSICDGDHREEYTVTFNIDGVQSVISVKEGEAIPFENPAKEGHTFVEWTPAIPDVMPAENLEFTAVFEVNSYSVRWIIDGMIISETHKFGEAMDQSKSFEKAGYTFIGWTPAIPETMPAYDLEFTAVFEINLSDAVFNANGGAFPDGDLVKRISTEHNTEIVAPQNPERAGYQFAGWAYNGKNIGTDVGIMDSADGKIFDAVWIPNEKTTYKVETYTMNTSGEYEVSYILVNAFVSEDVSVNPSASEGFEINEEKSVLSGTVTSEEMLVLKVYIDRIQYAFTTVVLDKETTVMYYYGSVVAEPSRPSADGYLFRYWEPRVPVIMPAHDVTVTAKLEEYRTPRIVMLAPEKRTIYYGESITLRVQTYDLPSYAKIKWEVLGDGVSIKPSASGKTCKVTSTSNGNVVIRAYIVDSSGNTITSDVLKPIYDSQYLYSEVTFWQVIFNFIKRLFGKTDTVSQFFTDIM